MSLWSRVTNVFRGDRVDREIEEELQSHIEEAIAEGRDPAEVRRAFGSTLRTREASHDLRVLSWLNSLRADIVFGWRQLWKSKTASAAAILSLALAVGACTAAFRLIDALLLRPLPVDNPESLYVLAYETRDREGTLDHGDSFDYPMFRTMREAVKDDAELMAISYSSRIDLTYGSDREMEKAYREMVSGWTMESFGLKPVTGRLLHAGDDVKPGGHPVAVISYDYWLSRFGGDPQVLGKKFRAGNDLYEIVGVLEKGFTGTEPGTMTDIFLPTMMNAKSIDNPHWGWFRIWVRPQPGASAEPVRERLAAALKRIRLERVKEFGDAPQQERDWYVNANVSLESAAAGFSGMQHTYRRAIAILAGLVALVLLIACANLANLLTAQATSRDREMALRVSIGAGRARLVRLVLAESAILAGLASVLGCFFAWWAAPFVVSLINPPDSPARFVLPADWRVIAFVVGLTVLVTLLFGLAPAIRASAVQPVSALKGGNDPHSRRRLMHAMIAAQVAFCFLVHFVAGLFVSSFDRLSNQPVGIVAERLLAVEVTAKDGMPMAAWDEVLSRVRTLPQVESAGLSSWALLSGNAWMSPVWANGKGPESGVSPYFLGASPEWLSTMRIRMLDGRDFRPDEVHPRAVIVNETFARRFFDGQNPTGKIIELGRGRNERATATVVGYVADTRYDSMRQSPPPIVFTPMNSLDEKDQPRTLDWGTIMVRTRTEDPLQLAALLRETVPNARPEFRVSGLRTQQEYIRANTVRERMLAMLSMFFATVALMLAAIGLYGVLDYSVVQLRREIGIRLALGAQADKIVRRVATEVFAMLALGSVVGLTLGIASERYLETLLYEVKATDFTMLVVPVVTILTAAVFAALPPVIRALRIDPAAMLRAE
jgi:predicted permease